jgi:hypothetical protein
MILSIKYEVIISDAHQQITVHSERSVYLQAGSSRTCPSPLMLRTRMWTENVQHVPHERREILPTSFSSCPNELCKIVGEHAHKLCY